MNDPYRKHISLTEEKVHKNIYKYILRTNYNCPICKFEIPVKHYIYGILVENDKYKLCHPLKRITVKGFWWWKKYCPVDGVHHHLSCNECKVSWITMQADQSEANPNVKDLYL